MAQQNKVPCSGTWIKFHQDVIRNEVQADDVKQMIENLAKKFTQAYGRRFTRDNLFRMLQFHKAFPEIEIVAFR